MKIIKKLLSAAIALSMIMCSLPAFAAESEALKEAILSVKNRIEIPVEFSEFESNINKLNDNTEYSLRWTAEDNSSIRIITNDKNDIVSYYLSVNQPDSFTPQFAKFTNEELTQRAIDWLTKVNPSWISELDIENPNISDYSGVMNYTVYINFKRKVNGIDFLGNSVSFNMNNQSGEITNMHSSWSYEADIPKPSEAMDKAEAVEEYLKLSPLRLEYKAENGVAKPIYNPTDPYVKINARKGGELGEDYAGAYKNEATADSASGGGSMNDGLTEAEIENLAEVEALLSEDELIKLAKGLENTNFANADYESCSYNKGYIYQSEYDEKTSRYFADMTFTFKSEDNNDYYGFVVFDAKTGELIRFYARDYSSYDEKEKPAVDFETAKKSGEAFINKYSSAEAEKTRLTTEYDEENKGEYYLSFTRFENNIPYYGNSINVEVSPKTGFITSYGKYWEDNMIFEPSDGIIDLPAAEQILKDNIEIELSYKYDSILNPDTKNIDMKVELCYTASSIKIDAKTGDVIKSEDNSYTAPQATDVSGHYAENQIKALIDEGVISLDEENPVYRPDDVIKKGELGQLVSSLKDSYLYNAASAEGSLRKMQILLPDEIFNAEDESKRIDGVTYIIRAIGYREVAELPDIFNCSFADAATIPANQIGYVTLARGLCIIRGDENGSFNADAPLTRADAAIMIYNYLAR